MSSVKTIGVIGGSGLYDLPGLSGVKEVALETPFGAPSDAYITGELDGLRLVFLPRHGRGHRFLPTEVNYAANIHGLKQLGVEFVISVSAVGSLKEEIHPGHVVVPDQFIDRTSRRRSTFFGNGVVGHISFGDPVCPVVRKLLVAAAQQHSPHVHDGGTYVVMEGPAFSTRAESNLHRSWGASVIGMTNLPEAKLAREAELCYATLALATDYDCWKEELAEVSVDAVVAVLRHNVALAREIVRSAVLSLRELPARTCACKDAARHAVMTAPEHIPAAARERLALIIGHHLPKTST